MQNWDQMLHLGLLILIFASYIRTHAPNEKVTQEADDDLGKYG